MIWLWSICPGKYGWLCLIMQQGLNIVPGIAQGRQLLGSQQARRRMEDKAAPVIGRQGPHLVCLVQLVQHRPRVPLWRMLPLPCT